MDVVINHYYEITGLERGTYYEIRVVAFDGHNRQMSETEVVGTKGFGEYYFPYSTEICMKKGYILKIQKFLLVYRNVLKYWGTCDKWKINGLMCPKT